MGQDIAVEICVEGFESARAAQEGGADRVELCDDLSVGGVTPDAGSIATACRTLTIPVHVLIRPRGGNFVYSDAELATIRREVAEARSLGASGVVLGLLNPDGSIDRERTARLVEAARPLAITFHKAFDACRDPHEALEVLAGLGIERILTSGQRPTAIEGLPLLADLARASGGRIRIMAGGSIREDDIPRLLAAGLNEIHIGSSVCTAGTTDAGKVRRAVAIAQSWHA